MFGIIPAVEASLLGAVSAASGGVMVWWPGNSGFTRDGEKLVRVRQEVGVEGHCRGSYSVGSRVDGGPVDAVRLPRSRRCKE